jgi:hypothetical protein
MDPLSFYLAKLIGLTLLILGIALVTRTQSFQNTVKDVAKSNALMTLISILPLVVGLAIVISHNIWIKHWTVLITIIGWLILLCGLARLFFHKELMKYMAKTAVNRSFFIFWGIIFIIFGGFLVAKSFFGTTF